MKAYKIEDDIVAAHTRKQALQTWANLFEENAADARSVEEIDPATFMVNYEQDDGTFKEGPLAAMMPTDNEPIVLITHDYS
jgi:hypothetical protein